MTPPRPGGPRVLHVITGLGVGGTERALLALLAGLRAHPGEHAVAVLRPGGALLPELVATGVTYACAGASSALGAPAAIARLARWARGWRPDVVQGWLVHGNLAAAAAARYAAGPGRRPPVVWGVRAGLADLGNEPRATRAALRLSVRLAGRTARIVYNSARSAAEHEQVGYPRDRRLVVPNGFDVDRFRPDADARRRVRAALGIPPAAPVVGLVARYHPQKDHQTFLRAAARLVARHPDAHFLLAGAGVDAGNPALAAAVQSAGLEAHVHLLGPRDDTPALYAALDVIALTSRTESFPNAVGEGMAAGAVPVVTDAGDVAALVGDAGTVVAVGDDAALADAWSATLSLAPAERARHAARARSRIVERFGPARVADEYAALYAELASTRAGRGA